MDGGVPLEKITGNQKTFQITQTLDFMTDSGFIKFLDQANEDQVSVLVSRIVLVGLCLIGS